MFENLRDAFREAIDNFRAELNREDVPPTVDRLLVGMQGEVAEARATLRALHGQIEQTRAQVLHESGEEATCRRREEMARRVGDDETARLAAEYAARHARRREVLERKSAALQEEHALRAGDVAEMLAHLREAQEKRDTLADAPDGPPAERAADELLDELDRMASEIGEQEADPGQARTRSAEEIERHLEREYGQLQVDPWAEIERPQVDYDERLAELKKRMKQE